MLGIQQESKEPWDRNSYFRYNRDSYDKEREVYARVSDGDKGYEREREREREREGGAGRERGIILKYIQTK